MAEVYVICIREIDHIVLRVVTLEAMLAFLIYVSDPEGNVVELKGAPAAT